MELIAASVVGLVLSVGPGLALAWAATPPHSRLRRVAMAASPGVTYGMVGGIVGWTTLVGLDVPPLGLLVTELVIAAAAVAWRVVATRRGTAPGAGIRPLGLVNRLQAHRADVVALGLSCAAAVTVAWLAAGRMGSPPGWDSLNHAFLARRIMQTGSADPAGACVTGSTEAAPACAFYPLAPHTVWAQVSELTGLHLSMVMLGTVVVAVPVIAAVGTFAIVRVCGGGSVTAACAAFLPVLIGSMWSSLITGRITVLLGAALAPSAALLFWLALRSPQARSLTALSSVSLAGITLAHTYDVVAGAFTALGLVLTRPPQLRLRSWVVRLLAQGLGAALILAPQVPDLLAGKAERGIAPPNSLRDLGEWTVPGQYIATFVGLAAPNGERTPPPLTDQGTIVAWVVSILILVGMAASLHPRLRWARPFAVVHLLILTVVIYIDRGQGWTRELVAGMYYGDPRRPHWSSIVAPAVLAFAGANAVAWLAIWPFTTLRRLTREGSLARRVVAPLWVVPVVVTALLTGLVAWAPDTWKANERLAARALPNDDSYDKVGEWIKARGGGVVADDLHRDFVTWIYADTGVALLRGLVPLKGNADADWAERTRVWMTLTATRPGRGTCLPDPYDVRWVVVSENHMPAGRRSYNPMRVAQSPYLTLVHTEGKLKVYAVNHLCGTGA